MRFEKLIIYRYLAVNDESSCSATRMKSPLVDTGVLRRAVSMLLPSS